MKILSAEVAKDDALALRYECDVPDNRYGDGNGQRESGGVAVTIQRTVPPRPE